MWDFTNDRLMTSGIECKGAVALAGALKVNTTVTALE
jgi:hypothetical protein